MELRPFRALLTARLQVLWNLAHRGRGAVGTLSALLISVIAIACLVPPFIMFVKFGGVLGEDLAASDSPSLLWLCVLHALLMIWLGGMAGLRHQAGFDRTLLRLFPLKPTQVLMAELPFNLIDTIPILGFTLFAGLGAGLVQALPSTAVHVLLIVLEGMLGLLLFQQIVGATRRLMTGSRLVMGILGLAAITALTLAAIFAGYHALRAAALGEGGRALMLGALPLAWTIGLFAIATRLQLLEMRQDPPLHRQRSKAETLWTFRAPAAGIARLMVSQVAGARAGLLVLVLPLFSCGMLVLAADILGRSAAGRDTTGLFLTALQLSRAAQALPLYVIVPVAVMLLNRELWMNQLAWESGGIKTLFLAPIGSGHIVRGKFMGLLMLQVPQALIAALPLLRLRMPQPWELLTGLVAALAVAMSLATIGLGLSVRHPRVIAARAERTEGAPASLTLLSTAIIGAHAVFVAGVVVMLGRIAPWLPMLVFAACAAGVLVARTKLIAALAAQVDAHREHVVETLG